MTRKPMKKIFLILLITLSAMADIDAQPAGLHKMSPLVCEALASVSDNVPRAKIHSSGRMSKVSSHASKHFNSLTAFVRIADDGERVLRDNGCTPLARFSNIYIASIPLNRLGALSLENSVMRIEAGAPCTAQMDTTRMIVNAVDVQEGAGLPQAYTGKGVVMGVMDIGFDLTHPDFFSPDMTEYRIKRLWDQLSADYDASKDLPVGAEYLTEEALLSYGCVRDGHKETHGTHTLGIAAGSGYTTDYRGLAWESDICLVANATSSDKEFIAEEDRYKYTSATDALGFKYIFDYAQSVGKPCVISFSEGAKQDLYGDDKLFYEVLDSLTGPGRILVASAGNNGDTYVHFHKPAGQLSQGTFVIGTDENVYFQMKSAEPFTIRTVVYSEHPDTVLIESAWPIAAADSVYTDTLDLADGRYEFTVAGYPSCYDPSEYAYEMLITAPRQIGLATPVSVEIVGSEADAHFFLTSGYMTTNGKNSNLIAGDHYYSILSPGSSPAAICVGATSYRTGFVNYKGERIKFNCGEKGERGPYSSMGPTFDGRVKPDVMAPGTNVTSARSSYWLDGGSDNWDIAYFDYNGQRYGWSANTGTSMSTPVVGGTIALWLQANPQLSPDDVREVIKKTSRRLTTDDAPLPNNQWGYGEIDAYKGLVEVLRMQSDGLDEISDYQPSGARFSMSGSDLRITFGRPLTRPATLAIYSINGTLLVSRTIPAGSADYYVSLANQPEAVYAVQLRSSDKGITGSTLVRK